MLDFHPGDLFTTDYGACRADFLARVPAALLNSCEQQSYPITEDCFADAIYLGAAGAEKVLVLNSGTHGVEGYAGSAMQRFLLQLINDGALRLPARLGLVMIHSLNPWGMRWARRCDQDGIDLNRNFCDFNVLPPITDDVGRVLEALSQPTTASTVTVLKQLQQQWGHERFDIACSEGQYHVPWAPFYGGREPARSQQVIDDVMARWHLPERELIVIDLHTGLGPWGYGELISDHPAGAAANTYARQLFGPAVAVTHEGESFSVPKHGLLDHRWYPLMTGKGCFLTLEFGTLSKDSLFYTLLDEHRFWRDHTPQRAPEAYARQREAMLAHFCPRDYLWQQGVLFRAWQVVHRVCEMAA